MTEPRHAFVVTASACVVFAIGTWFIARPSWNAASRERNEIRSLQERMRGLSGQERTALQLRAELENVEAEWARNERVIPSRPEMATLMQQLSGDVDGFSIADQTMNTGKEEDALVDGPARGFPERAVPLTVEMTGSFASVFELIQTTEEIDRLVRIESIRIATDNRKYEEDKPFVTATVGLEAIYAPSRKSGGGS